MKVGIFGGGMVGQAMGAKLAANGHEVVIGIRSPNAEELGKPRNGGVPLKDWSATTGGKVKSLADAARHGEILINATSGGGSLEALTAAGATYLSDKMLVDAANPLDFSGGAPWLLPQYAISTSLGEEIQKAFPATKVVKAFNTISFAVMVDPKAVPGPHDLFVSGNDEAAKEAVKAFAAKEFGWNSFMDLGDISGARAQEAWLIVWMRLWKATGTHLVNVHVSK